ncbi:MAG: DUF2520 domain-containing protein [Eubacterium sp.]|nr:DUF2520 domain-containing protein [Eubacterium sp.]
MMKNKKSSIGFIGAGRVGITLGRYFFAKNQKIAGYYSKTYSNACHAAELTQSTACRSVEEILIKSNIVFITVPDRNIYEVYLQLKNYDLRNKILCHCSGALSADIFNDVCTLGAYGFSVHPVFAINDKTESYKHMPKAFFTVEGSNEKMHIIENLLQELGNNYRIIKADQKQQYHTALVMASNLAIGLYHMSAKLLEDCGFNEEAVQNALSPLYLYNAVNLSEKGCCQALTGPIDRNDLSTVQKHINVLESFGNEEYLNTYNTLSRELIKIAKQKYPDVNYSEMEKLLSAPNSQNKQGELL